MDLERMDILCKYLQTEEANLSSKIHQLESQLFGFKKALWTNRSRNQFVEMIRQEISKGENEVLIKIVVEINNSDKLREIHSRLYQILRDCGIKEAKVEGKNEYLARIALLGMDDTTIVKENTFISFPN